MVTRVYGQFTYWVNGSSSKTTIPATPYTTSGTVRADIPASVTQWPGRHADRLDRDVQRWLHLRSGWPFAGIEYLLFHCGFAGARFPHRDTRLLRQPGRRIQRHVHDRQQLNAATDPATQLVWELDTQPSTASPAASQVVKLASGQTSASVTLTVASPGPTPSTPTPRMPRERLARRGRDLHRHR